MSVVFPLPFGPTAATRRPASTRQLTFRSAGALARPYRTVTSGLPRSRERPPEENREQWNAHEGGDDPDGQLERTHHHPGDDVAEHEETSAREKYHGKQGAMDRARDGPHRVRNDGPTKPMMPQAATLAAVSSAVQTYTTRMVRPTSAPRYWAGSSPSESRSSALALSTRTSSGTAEYAVKIASDCHDDDPKPPRSQRKALRVAGANRRAP